MKYDVDNSKISPALRWMPSLADVAFLMPLIFLFSRMQGVRTLLSDADTGWHVRAGEWMLDHHAVIRTDPFSFTKPGEPWFAWEWLWEVCFAWLHRQGGLALVVFVSAMVICTTFGLLYRVVLRRCGNPLIAIGVTVLAAAGSTVHFLARPHLFSWLFLVIFLAILDRVEQGRIELLLWLPVLTAMWTNIHGGFLAGIVILAAYCGGSILTAFLTVDASERTRSGRAAGSYALAAAGCALASFANPYGFGLHTHIWHYLRDPDQTKGINEFQPVNFQLPVANFLEWMLFLAIAAVIWFGLRKRFVEVLLLLGWAHLALIMARNVPLFLIVASPAVAEAGAAWSTTLCNAQISARFRGFFSAIHSIAGEITPAEQVRRFHLISALAAGLLFTGMTSRNAGMLLKPDFNEKAYPFGALAALADPGARIFTPDEWGDYLIYRLAPQGRKVFVDGRSDFYGGKFVREYSDLLNVKYNWQQTLDRYGVDTVLLPTDTPLASTLKESARWRVTYDDGISIVFRPRQPASTIHLSTLRHGDAERAIAAAPANKTTGVVPIEGDRL